MKIKFLSILFLFVASTTFLKTTAQITAMSYDFTDCNGNPQSLYADLDAGKALILEFFMNSCSPCISAAATLEVMKADLQAEFPGMIKAYTFGFSDSYDCTLINNWVTTNGVTSIPSDSGALQVAYYGGMGMPTIVILGGGIAHTVLGTPYLSYTTSDTSIMATDIRNFLNGTGVAENNSIVSHINVFPNPASDQVNVNFELKEIANISIDIIDVAGRIVATQDNKNKNGFFSETFNTSKFSNGSYILRIKTNNLVTQQKLNIIRNE